MEHKISMKIDGSVNGEPLTPKSFDISELKRLLDNAVKIFASSTNRKNSIIHLDLVEGSMLAEFYGDETAILTPANLLQDYSQNEIIENGEDDVPKFLLDLQSYSKEYDRDIEISSSLPNILAKPIKITKNTNYRLNDEVWLPIEDYVYARIVRIGGQRKCYLTIETEEYGTFEVMIPKEEIERSEQKLIYTKKLLHISGEQNYYKRNETRNWKVIQFVHGYSPGFKKDYMSTKISKNSELLKGRDIEKELRQFRGE